MTDECQSTLQQVVHESKSMRPGGLSEAEAAARQATEAKQRELFEAQLGQQRQKQINEAHMELHRRAAQAAPQAP